MSNDNLTFKINSDNMKDTIDNITKETNEIADMCETAKEIVEAKLAEHGVPGDITQVIIDAYERDVITEVEKNNEANKVYIRKSTEVNDSFEDTQRKNNSLFN